MKSFVSRMCGIAGGLAVLISGMTAPLGVYEPAVLTAAAEDLDLSPEAVYQAMIAFQADYPEGTPWTNDNFYAWNGGIYSGGYGCAGFAFMLSDAAFGSLKAREYTDVNAIRIGDILRINNDSHSVIVLDVTDGVVTVAEGNFNKSVHWGRTFTFDKLREIMDYAYTRYPEDAEPTEPGTGEVTEPTETETEEDTDQYYYIGDVNMDHDVSVTDLVVLQKYVLGVKELSWFQILLADVNGDDSTDVFDLAIFKRYYL